MGEELFYLSETSNRYKLRVFFFIVVGTIVLLGTLFAIFGTVFGAEGGFGFFDSVKDRILYEMNNFSFIGLFYAGLIGGLFFIPLPQELLFYSGLLKGNSIFLSFLTINAGFFLAQVLNYLCGFKLSGFFMHLVSKKKVYKTKRFVNKYGSVGIFLFNLFPFPAPLLTFALGVTKYSRSKLFFYMALGVLSKYAIMVFAFLLFK